MVSDNKRWSTAIFLYICIKAEVIAVVCATITEAAGAQAVCLEWQTLAMWETTQWAGEHPAIKWLWWLTELLPKQTTQKMTRMHLGARRCFHEQSFRWRGQRGLVTVEKWASVLARGQETQTRTERQHRGVDGSRGVECHIYCSTRAHWENQALNICGF